MPVFAKINYIDNKELRPSSDNVDLITLWKDDTNEKGRNKLRKVYV